MAARCMVETAKVAHAAAASQAQSAPRLPLLLGPPPMSSLCGGNFLYALLIAGALLRPNGDITHKCPRISTVETLKAV